MICVGGIFSKELYKTILNQHCIIDTVYDEVTQCLYNNVCIVVVKQSRTECDILREF